MTRLAVLRACVGWSGVSVLCLVAGHQRVDAASVDRVEPADSVGHAERAPRWLRSDDQAQPPVLVFPAVNEGKKPVVMMLHGMCGAPENECPSFAGESTRDRLLLCPRANLRCDGGGTIWSGDPRIRTTLVNDFMARAAIALPERLDTTASHTLVGFSLGTFVALDVAQRSPGRWKNLILLGARIHPDAKLLKEAGVESVLLGAGDHDMVKEHMVRVTAALQKKGIRATFRSLGKVGHSFAPDMDAWLTDAFSWLDHPDQS